MTVDISKQDLERAAANGLISTAQVDSLWCELKRKTQGRARFGVPHVAYYFGALVVMSAMGWYVTRAWERLGGAGLLVVAVVYAATLSLVGHHLSARKRLEVPGGLLFTLAVWMTPLAVYGFERMTGLWLQRDPGAYRDYYEWVRSGWFPMEVGTILAGLVALRFVRFPFLTFPVAFALWFMSMDLTPLLYGRPDFTWNERLWVSLWFGVALLLISVLVDRRTREDFAFWGYLFGMLAFWSGLSLMESGSELADAVYCLVNLALIVISVLLDRRVFMVCGALGIFGYLGHLSYTVFKDSLLFPFVMSAIGLAIIWVGILYERNRTRIEGTLLGLLPAGARQLLPKERWSR